MKQFLAVLILAAAVSARADDAAPAAPAAAPAAPAADAAPADPASAVKVVKLTLTTGIKDRDAVDESATFSAGFPVYCWAKFAVTNPPATVKFVWTKDGKSAGDYSAELKTANARWWAKKSATPGAWKVEIVDDKGASLSSAEFTVTAAAAPEKDASAAPAAPKAGGQ
jgi:hypothetical protein